MAKRKRTKGKTAIYKTLHRKLKQCEFHQKIGVNFEGAPEELTDPVPLVTPVVSLLLQTWWYVMKEERTGKCLRQVEHILGHLWHRYIVTAYQVMLATITLLKGWLQVNQYEPLVQYLPCKQQPSIKEILIGTTSAGIPNQLRDIYTI